MKRYLFLLILLPISLMACSTINEEGKAFTDENIRRFPQSNRIYDAIPSFKRREWKEGEWVAYMGKRGENISFTRYTVLEKVSERAYWLQVESADYHSKPTLVRLLIEGYDPIDPSDMRITAVKVRDDNGEIIDVPLFASSIYRYIVQNLLIDVTESENEDVHCPAGRFNGAFRVTADVYFGPFRAKSTVWFHPIVPIFGYVRSEAEGGNQVMELLGFGE